VSRCPFFIEKLTHPAHAQMVRLQLVFIAVLRIFDVTD
jgi:hypothetical protein